MWRFRSEGRGVVLDSTSSTPRRENASNWGISRAAVVTWWEERARIDLDDTNAFTL
jgi:hypothetical protein